MEIMDEEKEISLAYSLKEPWQFWKTRDSHVTYLLVSGLPSVLLRHAPIL